MQIKEAETLSYPFSNLLRDLWQSLKKYKGKFFLVTFIRILGDLVDLYIPFGIAKIVTILSSGNIQVEKIWITLGLILLAATVSKLAVYLARRFGYGLSFDVVIDTEREMMKILLLRSIAWHEKENTGNKLKRISNGSDGFGVLIRLWVTNLIQIAIRFTGSLIIFSQFNIGITLAVGIFLSSYYVISVIMAKSARKAALEVNRVQEEENGLEFEIANNVRSVKVLAIGSTLLRRLSIVFDLLRDKYKKRIRKFRRRSAFLDWYGQAYRIGILAIIIAGIAGGHYEVGFLVLFDGYFMQLREGIKDLSDLSQEVTVAKQSITRMFNLIGKDTEELKTLYDSGTENFPKGWQALNVEHVSFSYGQAEALKNISFSVKRGERIGIIGLSGAGKSTLFKLLLKEHSTYKGTIAVDSLSIQKIRTEDYLAHASVVLQDTEVFNFSLKDNITLVNPKEEKNEALLARALHVSHVEDFLHKLPQGLDTLIGEKGVKLSGGEKQRLGIARAIFKNPDILFMDEATSHLDLESEEKIRDSLHTFFENVTAIVIAHRLTTIREMDRILVIEGGELIEEGTFDELYSSRGRFYELWEKQKFI